MNVIDVHVHPVGIDLVHDKRNLRLMQRGNKLLSQNPIETLLERMDAGGISKACLLGPSPCDGIGLSNEMVRDAVARHPERFFGFAGVDPGAQEKTAVKFEIERAIKEWGFKGVGEFGGCDYLAEEWAVVYETCIELSVPVLVHVGVPLPSMLLKYGHPALLDELANRYPDLKIIAAHVGMPWILETIAVAVRHANVYLDISALPHMRWELIPIILSLCIEKGLEEQMLFGSDFPVVDPAAYVKFLERCSVLSPLRWYFKLPELTAAFKQKLLYGNAANLLGIAG